MSAHNRLHNSRQRENQMVANAIRDILSLKEPVPRKNDSSSVLSGQFSGLPIKDQMVVGKKQLKIAQLLLLLTSLLFIAAGCGKEEEISPLPPQEQEQSQADPEVPEGETSELDLSSEVYQHGKFGSMPYRILVPRNFDSTKKYPLHVFLHGQGQRGTDNEHQLEVGASYYQEDSVRENYPAFIVVPQCPMTQNWFDDWATETLNALIDNLVKNYPINEERISICGFSMGAYGTFAMVARHPHFEAAVAISGAGEDRKAPLMAQTKWRIFAGKNDVIVPSSESRNMAIALQNAGASVTFTLYNQTDHNNTWVKAFSEPDFFYWLFSDTSKR
ncbi:MAG: dienelactone hydrolase family protein [Cyclobacteriaceae bacterium]